MPAEYCRELACTPDVAPPLAPPEVQELLLQHFGDKFDSIFERFDYTLPNANLLFQAHPARLRSGNQVTVVLLRPEYYEIQNERGLTSFIAHNVIAQQSGYLYIEGALPDFLATLKRKTDLSSAGEALESIARQEASLNLQPRRKVHRELSNPKILVLEQIECKQLGEILATRKYGLDALASMVCYTWLEHALTTGYFPADPSLREITISANDQISFNYGCEWVALPRATRENMWQYLLAAVVDDPDRSASYLLREMQPARRGEIDIQSFRSSFRQSAYFAVLEPVLGTDSNAMAQLVFQHWKTALEHGYCPKPLLLSFYRGLFTIARIAREISLTEDALREGMDELRTRRIFQQVRELVDLGDLMQNADKFAGAFMNFPRTLDDALAHASRPQQEPFIANNSDPPRRDHGPSIAMFLVVIALLIPQFSHLSDYTAKMTIAALMLAGLIVLRGLVD